MEKYRTPETVQRYISFEKTIRGLSDNTCTEYEKDLLLFLRFLCMQRRELPDIESVSPSILEEDINADTFSGITRDDIYAFLYYMDQDRSSSVSTRRKRLSALSGLFRYLRYEEEAIENIPTEGIPHPKQPRRDPVTLTVREAEKILAAARDISTYPERDVCILTFLLHLGLRRSELVGINTTHIRDDRVIHIYGKGDKERAIPLDDACIQALSEYMPKRIIPPPGGDRNALFTGRNKRRISTSTVYKMIKKTASAAGLDEKISPHACRHTFATLLLEDSSDIITLQELMGHESISTTRKYVHLTNKKHRDLIEGNPLNRIQHTKGKEKENV